MFKKFEFEGISVGTKHHAALLDRLTTAAGEGKEVVYEEYDKLPRMLWPKDKHYVDLIQGHTEIVSVRPDLLCRGHILP